MTEADLAVDAALKDQLRAARPGYGWLSEETPDDAARLSHDSIFVIDPIDGTRAYIDGQDTWALSLAIVTQGRPAAAVVYLPAKDRIYTAAAGEGAQCDGVAMRAADRGDVTGARILANKMALDAKHWPNGMPEFSRHFRPSLAYRMSLVAEGRYDGMITFRDAWEWDIAAGALLAEEAGARVTDRHGGALAFNSAGAKTAGVVCAPEGVWRGILG